MNKEVAGFFLVYSEQEHKGEYHLYIRGLFLRYDKAFDAAIRLTKWDPYDDSEPNYRIIHEKKDEVRLLNTTYEDDDSTHEEIVISRQHVQ